MSDRPHSAALISALAWLAVAAPALATECTDTLVSQSSPRLQGPGYYSVLGVSRTASAREIKTAYRKLSRASHPDLASGQSVEDRHRIQQDLNAAYGVLGDPELRRKYDDALASNDAVREFYAAMARVHAPSELLKNNARYQKDKSPEDLHSFVRDMMSHPESADLALLEKALRMLNEKATAWKAFTLPEAIAHFVERALVQLFFDKAYPYSDFARSVGGWGYNPKNWGGQKHAYARPLAEKLLKLIDRLPVAKETEAARDQLKIFFLSDPLHQEHELAGALARPLDRLMILFFALEPVYSKLTHKEPIWHFSKPSWLEIQSSILDEIAGDPLTFARFSWLQRYEFASAIDTLPLHILGARLPARQFVQLIKIRFDLQDLLEKDAPLMSVYAREKLLAPNFKDKLFRAMMKWLSEPQHKHAADTVLSYDWTDPEAAGRAIFGFSDLSLRDHTPAIERLLRIYLDPPTPDSSERREKKLAALAKHRGVPLLIRQRMSEAATTAETRRLFIDSILEGILESKRNTQYTRFFDISYSPSPITRQASLGRDRAQISQLRLSAAELELLRAEANGTPFEEAFNALKAARPAS